MPVTMRIIIPDSGSSRSSHGTWNSPMPEVVSKGIGGIHWGPGTMISPASGPSSCQNATTDSTSDTPIVPQATAAANGLLK